MITLPATHLQWLRASCCIGRNVDSSAGGQQCPILRVPELQVKVGGGESPIRIPGTSCTHIKQPAARLGQNVSPVREIELNLLARSEQAWEDHRQNVVSAARQRCAFQCLVLNQFQSFVIHFYATDLEITGELKEQRAHTTSSHIELNSSLRAHRGRRTNLSFDLVRPRGYLIQLLGSSAVSERSSSGVEIDVKGAQLCSIDPGVQKAIGHSGRTSMAAWVG